MKEAWQQKRQTLHLWGRFTPNSSYVDSMDVGVFCNKKDEKDICQLLDRFFINSRREIEKNVRYLQRKQVAVYQIILFQRQMRAVTYVKVLLSKERCYVMSKIMIIIIL